MPDCLADRQCSVRFASGYLLHYKDIHVHVSPSHAPTAFSTATASEVAITFIPHAVKEFTKLTFY
jgi:hypothetical protein